MSRQIVSIVGGKDAEAASTYDSVNPARTGEIVARVGLADAETFAAACRTAKEAQREWAKVPAPVRGRKTCIVPTTAPSTSSGEITACRTGHAGSSHANRSRPTTSVVEGIARVTLVPELSGRTLSAVEAGVTVRAPLEGTVDVADWLGKQKKRLAEFDKQIRQAQGKLNNEGFVARAPAEVIEEERRRVADFGAQKERLEQVLAQFA